jgi:hypothetical protein
MASLAVARTANSPTLLDIDEASDNAQVWFIIKSDVGRCGDGMQVGQSSSRTKRAD